MAAGERRDRPAARAERGRGDRGGADRAGLRNTGDGRGARTTAQTVALALGAILVLAGIIGFFVNADFDTGNAPPGDELLGFEVNGWHNIAHIATGGLLLFGAGNARLAVTVLLAFAASYLVLTVWGFVEETNVVQLLAINDADNWLHVALTVVAGIAGLVGLKGLNDMRDDRRGNNRRARA